MSKKTVAGTPADPTLGYVPLELGGTTYKLIYDFDAIAKAEEATGMSLFVGLDWRALSVRQLRGMLLGALLKFQPETKIEALTKYINAKHTAAILGALIQAWLLSVPDPEPEETHPQTPGE